MSSSTTPLKSAPSCGLATSSSRSRSARGCWNRLNLLRREYPTGVYKLLLGFDQQHLIRAGRCGLVKNAEHRGGGERHRLGGGARPQVMREEQSRHHIP